MQTFIQAIRKNQLKFQLFMTFDSLSIFWSKIQSWQFSTKFTPKLTKKLSKINSCETWGLLRFTLTRVGFSMKFWLHCHLSFLYFCFPFTSLENLKCAIGGELFFLSEWICRHQLCLKGKTYIKDNVKMALFWINFFLALYNPNLNL